MTGSLLQILASSEPFWKHPVVIVIILIVLVSLILSIIAGILKLLGVSLLMFFFFPLLSRIGRFLTLGLIVGIGGTVLLSDHLDRFIKPTMSADEAYAKIKSALEEDNAWGGGTVLPDVGKELTLHIARLDGTRGDEAASAVRSLKRVTKLAAELKDARSEMVVSGAGFAAAFWAAEKKPAAEGIERIRAAGGDMRKALRKERKVLRELAAELPAELSQLETARAALDDARGTAGMLAQPIAAIEKFANAVDERRKVVRKALRTLRKACKVALRNRIVDAKPETPSE